MTGLEYVQRQIHHREAPTDHRSGVAVAICPDVADPIMTAWLAVLFALGEAACAALAATLQHKTATRSGMATPTATPTGKLAAFVRHQLGQRLWWIAQSVQAGALLLHATALQFGPLTLVQPMLASVVVMALPLNHHLNRSRITLAEMLWAGLVAASLASFLLVAAPSHGTEAAPGHRLVIAGIVVAAAVACCVLVAQKASSRIAALALGSASGLSFSMEALLLQATTKTLLSHPLAVLTDPISYGLVVAGAAGVTLTQLAYRAGPISAALPAVITINPIGSVVLGVLVNREQMRTSPLALLIEVASFAGLALAVAALSRFPGAISLEAPAAKSR
jgi:hypothetical protein